MKRRRARSLASAIGALACAFALAGNNEAFAQGYSPEEAVSHMTLAEGLEATLVASEPMIRQPVCIEFDDHGRLWVVQYLQYPNPAGLKRAAVDRYSRTTYDRIPEPPPNGPKGADRVTILIDDDHDGRAETSKDFLSDLNMASGIAFGHGGVFVLQIPYLLFYADANRDDVPDGAPKVCLAGFGMQDSHSVANSLTWGPDGWLYGLQGSTCTANIRGIEFQQGVWRYNVKEDRFELFAEGGGNMWGLDYDAEGNMFASTNFGPYVALHIVQGAYYWKSFAKHGELHNPYAYGYFEHMTHHGATGGHVTDGGIVYQGGLLGPAFDGKYIANNLLSHAIYYHDLKPVGSTFETAHAGVLLDSHDASFAPSDLTTGPDGALYVADWNDKRTAHPDPDADWNKDTGRIYRIAPKGSKPKPEFDLGAIPEPEIVNLIGQGNAWHRRRARVQMASRKADLGRKDTIAKLRLRLDAREGGQGALESIWGLHALGVFDAALASKCLAHSDAAIQKWAVALIGDDPGLSSELGGVLKDMVKKTRDPKVASQLASTARRLKPEAALELTVTLVRERTDAADHFIPLLEWWAIEPHCVGAVDRTIALLKKSDNPGDFLFNQAILPKLVRRYAAEGTPACDAACADLLRFRLPDLIENGRVVKPAKFFPDEVDLLLEGMDSGLRERGRAKWRERRGMMAGSLYDEYVASSLYGSDQGPVGPPPPSPELMDEINRHFLSDPADPLRLATAINAGSALALSKGVEIVADREQAAGLRQAAVEALARRRDKSFATPLLRLACDHDEEESLRAAALDALLRVADDSASARLSEAYSMMPSGLRARTRALFFSRRDWAAALLAKVDEGAIPADDFKPAQLRNVALFEDAALDALVKKHWGAISGGTPEEKLATARRLNNDLRASKGDPARGKEVFDKTCAKCHTLFGEGAKIGPDLTQANRMDTDYMLVSLVDPSAVIRKEYVGSIIEMKDGGVLSGIIVDRPAGAVTLANGDGQTQTIPLDGVKEIRESTVSIMPEDLATQFTPQELRDLFAYLQSPEPKLSN